MDYLMLLLIVLTYANIANGTWHLSLHRLQSNNCDDKRCPEAKFREVYIEWCNYKCPANEKFICQEDEQENVIEYCLPVNLTCEPGYYVKGKIDPDDGTKVIVEKLQCPKGTYKQHASYCIDECVIQEEEYFLPDMFMLYENGSYKEAAKVICDYNKNYYSNTDQEWYYYDGNLTSPYTKYCVQIKDNPCPSGQRPLKDGTCVCVLDNMSIDRLSKKAVTVEDISSTSSTSMSSITEQPGLTSPTTGILYKNNEYNWIWIWIGCTIAGFLVLFIVVSIIVYKCRGKVTHINQNTIHGDFINHQTNMNYNHIPEQTSAAGRLLSTERDGNGGPGDSASD